MVSAIYREGEEKGRRSMFLDMLKSRFAGVDADIERQVRSLSDGDLKKLMPILFTAQSLNEIEFPKPEAKNPPRGANGNGNGR